jgi:hypothetical protein
LGGHVESTGSDRVTALVGSALGYRLLGAYLASGRRRLPVRVTVGTQLADDNQMRVSVQLEDASGWYLYRIRVHELAFDKRCDEILASLKSTQAVNPVRPWPMRRVVVVLFAVAVVIGVLIASYLTYPSRH